MTVLSMKLRNQRRTEMASRQTPIRLKLREIVASQKASDAEKAAATTTLQKLARNGSATRVRNRCVLTGRGRGVYRRFGLCRNKFRELALLGRIPGVMKASW